MSFKEWIPGFNYDLHCTLGNFELKGCNFSSLTREVTSAFTKCLVEACSTAKLQKHPKRKWTAIDTNVIYRKGTSKQFYFSKRMKIELINSKLIKRVGQNTKWDALKDFFLNKSNQEYVMVIIVKALKPLYT